MNLMTVQEAQKQMITRGLEQLGPERVARALKNHSGASWVNCFLAAAYGEPGALRNRMYAVPVTHPGFEAAVILGIDPHVMHAIVSWYDDGTRRPELLRLAEEWLEQNRRPVERAAVVAG